MVRTAYDVLLDWAASLGLVPRVEARAAAGGRPGAGTMPPLAMPSPSPGPGSDWPERAPPFDTVDIPRVLRALDERLADAEAELEAQEDDGDAEAAAYRRLKVEALRDDIRTLRDQWTPKAS